MIKIPSPIEAAQYISVEEVIKLLKNLVEQIYEKWPNIYALPYCGVRTLTLDIPEPRPSMAIIMAAASNLRTPPEGNQGDWWTSVSYEKDKIVLTYDPSRCK